MAVTTTRTAPTRPRARTKDYSPSRRSRRARFSGVTRPLRRGLAWGRKAWWIEIITVVVGYGLYEIVQGAAPAHRSDAFANAGELLRWERGLHLNPELAINGYVNAHSVLATVSGYYYDSLHYLITPSVLIWLWWRRPDVYGRWRSALVGASIASLVVFWAWPLAPPRLAEHGIVDTLVVQHIMGSVETHSASTLVNDYAAMPSLHVGWALWCATTIFATTHGRWRALVWLYPVLTTFVVIATGNHYLFDAVGGIVVLAVGMLVTAGRVPMSGRERRRQPIDGQKAEPQNVGTQKVDTSITKR
jgi:hypothetical protein